MSEEKERLVLTVDEVARRLRISRSTAFKRCNDGSIGSVRIGRRILVPVHRLNALLDGQQAAQPQA